MKFRLVLIGLVAAVISLLASLVVANTATAGVVTPMGGTGGTPACNMVPSDGQLVYVNGRVLQQLTYVINADGSETTVPVKYVSLKVTKLTSGFTSYRWAANTNAMLKGADVTVSNPAQSNHQWSSAYYAAHYLSTTTLPSFQKLVNGKLVYVHSKVVSLYIYFKDMVHLSCNPAG